MKILLVDDSYAVAGLYQQMLEAHEYEVITAHSGEEAIELAIQEQPDIGVLDFHLPDITGEELPRRLLSHPVTKDMVISILSSYSDVTRKSLDAGAIDMITKETPEELFLLRIEALERKVLLQRDSKQQLGRMERARAEDQASDEIPFKVLLVDDSRFARSAYQAMMEESGCTVLLAENMQEALAVAREQRPDLAVVDFYMKGGNGDELTRALLNDPLTQNVLVVILTSQMEIKEIALAAGAIDVIYKGEQQGTFIQRVASIREYRRQIGRQIHQHMRSAEEARRLHEWVDSILHSMREPVMVLDSRGGVIHTNSAAEKLLGLPVGEILGQKMSSFFLEEMEKDGYREEMLERMRGRLQQRFEGNRDDVIQLLQSAPIPLVMVDVHKEQMAQGDQGTSRVALVNHEMERLLGYEEHELNQQSILDLVMESEKEKIQGVLRSTDAGLRCMGYKGCRWCSRSGEPVPASVCMVTLEGETHYHVILLVKTEETLDQDLVLMTPFGQMLAEQESLQSDAHFPSLSADRTLRCSGGRTVPVHVSGALLSHSSGESSQVEGAVLVLHDLSERLRDEQQQQYLAFQSGIAEMSASILHHVGNTLVGIGGRVSGIGQRVQDLKRLQEILNGLGDATDVSREAIREALKVSARALGNLSGVEGIDGDLNHISGSIQRIEKTISVHRSASRTDLSNSRFPFAGMVHDALLLLSEPMQEARISLKAEIDRSQDRKVEMPRNPAIQMVLNLVQNSIDAILRRQQRIAAEWSGEIRVVVQSDAEKMVLLIEDNGCGIEVEQRPHLFTPGYSTKLDGSGFGLHSVGGFLQGVGGELELLSEGRDRGTAAKIIL